MFLFGNSVRAAECAAGIFAGSADAEGSTVVMLMELTVEWGTQTLIK